MKKIKKDTFPRLIKLLLSFYKAPFILVVVCICLSAIATASPSLFQRNVIDTASEAIYDLNALPTLEKQQQMLENGKKKYAYEIVELAREISEGK